MKKLPEVVTHPELVAEIVKQFAFMKVMAQTVDSNYEKLTAVSLDDVFNKADEFFVDFCTIEEAIETNLCNLTERITEFLQPWKSITDITAIQQNIHHNISLL